MSQEGKQKGEVFVRILLFPVSQQPHGQAAPSNSSQVPPTLFLEKVPWGPCKRFSFWCLSGVPAGAIDLRALFRCIIRLASRGETLSAAGTVLDRRNEWWAFHTCIWQGATCFWTGTPDHSGFWLHLTLPENLPEHSVSRVFSFAHTHTCGYTSC